MDKIIWNPGEIEKKSMEIIEKEVAAILPADPLERAVVRRIIHTTGDTEIVPLINFSKGAAKAGHKALRKGAKVFTDVNMLASGISKKAISRFGGEVLCSIADSEVIQKAKEDGKTRASTAMRLWGGKLNGQIVAIGNAPTALFELLQLAEEDAVRPALVVGIPVGFVGAAESKEELKKSGLPYITVTGTRGGSNIAAAIVNALLYFRGGRDGF